MWIVLLLVGTNIGAIIQMGEAFGFAVVNQWPDAPNWLWDRSGEIRQRVCAGQVQQAKAKPV